MLAAVLVLVPAVAVMPFRDLSGGRGQAGEALRETVASDLRGVAGLRVLERADIDRIIAEQNLEAKKRDLDQAGSIRVGTLLGATWIVAGAYQRAGAEVRLTARFVDVATGEIKGTAKVDGPEREILALQDRVTVELLRSMGLTPKPRARARAPLKSLQTMELYGDAVVERDDARRATLLRATLEHDPGFEYAAHDLDLLEKRLKALSELHDAAKLSERDAAVARTLQSLADEKDPSKRWQLYMNAMSALQGTRRFHQLERVARAAIAEAPPPPAFQTLPIVEPAQMYVVLAGLGVGDDDGVLREGEIFLSRFPKSGSFEYVKRQMDNAIASKRKHQEGGAKAAAEIARAGVGDACFAAMIYRNHEQWDEARRRFEAALQSGCSWKQAEILGLLVDIAVAQRDRAAAHRFAEKLRAIDPKKKLDDIDLRLPAD